MRKFVWKRRDGWSKPRGLKALMAYTAVNLVVGTGPFTISQDGETISKKLTRSEALSRFRKAISSREIGPIFRIRKANGTVVVVARAVVAVSDVDSTSGNSRCDVYWNWVKANFSQYHPRYAGAYVCKQISGSSTLSQHSYGNAVDVFFDTFAHQDRVARAVVENKGDLQPYHVISGQSIWTKGVGWTGYRGEYHSHLHVDFDPQRSGSCGVKG